MGLRLYIVFQSRRPSDETDTRSHDQLIAEYANGTSEEAILADATAYMRSLAGERRQRPDIYGAEITTEADAAVKDYRNVRTAAEPVLVVEQVYPTFRGQLTEDADTWKPEIALYHDTSIGQNDGANDHEFPGHSAEYLIVYNDSGAAIAEGELLTWTSNAYNQHHEVKTRDASTQVVAGVALEAIADNKYGKMAVGDYCDVLCSSSNATIGLPLYASASSEDRATTTTTGHFLGNSVGGVGVLGYATNWARVKLDLGAGGSGIEGIRIGLIVGYNKAYADHYSEMTYHAVSGDLVNVDVWEDSGKTLKLFSKVIAYTAGNVTTVTLTDELASLTLTKTITYTGGGDVDTVTAAIA